MSKLKYTTKSLEGIALQIAIQYSQNPMEQGKFVGLLILKGLGLDVKSFDEVHFTIIEEDRHSGEDIIICAKKLKSEEERLQYLQGRSAKIIQMYPDKMN